MGGSGGSTGRNTTVNFVTTGRRGSITSGGSAGRGIRQLNVTNGGRGANGRTRQVFIASPGAVRRANAGSSLASRLMSELRGVRSRSATRLRALARQVLGED